MIDALVLLKILELKVNRLFKTLKTDKYKKKIFIFILSLIFLTFLDQLIKQIIENNVNSFESFILIPKILKITYLKNYGAAFGILFKMRMFLIFVTASFLIMSIFLVLKLRISNFYYLFAFLMLVSGGFGNLIDRIFKGYVVDYCDLIFWPFENFAIFNLADFLTIIGCLMLFFKILFSNVDFEKLLNRLIKQDK